MVSVVAATTNADVRFPDRMVSSHAKGRGDWPGPIPRRFCGERWQRAFSR